MIYFIGCDISKADFYAAFEENEAALRFTNDRGGIGKFIRGLRERSYGQKDTVIGMESTGFYHLQRCFVRRKVMRSGLSIL